jgi:DNA replication protein DnaC
MKTNDKLDDHLHYLKLHYIQENYKTAASHAAKNKLSHIDFLTELVEQEAQAKNQRSIERRIKNARFPYIKTLEQFQWNYPKKINRQQIQFLARTDFIEQNTNIIFCGGVGLGKTHLAIAIAHRAAMKTYSVFFTTAVDIINNLAAAQRTNRFVQELKKYTSCQLLIIDELGYLPIDKQGADLLFQVVSQRYERGAIMLTTNRIFKDWAIIFNNDSTIASAVLDRLMHHSEVIIIEGKSYRMKDKLTD